MMLQKPVFLLLYAGGLAQTFSVVWHGLPLDFSMAGYLSALPGLLLLVSALPLRALHSARAECWLGRLLQGWLALGSLLVSLAFVANCALYGYWRFPLDATPIFFITSSPADAMASVAWWQAVGGVAAVAVAAAFMAWAFRKACRFFLPAALAPARWWGVPLMLVVVAALFLPIRGGFSVATMNTGKAYFSDNETLNHAAVNPLFSFLESVSHQEDFKSQYRYMDDGRAQALVGQLNRLDTAAATPDTCVLAVERPDVYLIVLESFSDTLTRQPGITPTLNRLKREGLWFSHFYANSFRTDRGLLSILQGYPAPATVSLMKFPRKTAAIPSLGENLSRVLGYRLHYYYGGDADFTNMRSFLVNQGFSRITEDVDFPVSARVSKWGVPDHLLFRRVEADLARERPTNRPTLRVIQTSSSHEPFDVPYHHHADKVLNAFAYADSCVGGFVGYLKRSGRWRRSLVVLVPDHLGAWPADADNFKPWRFHIPLIWMGGAVGRPSVIGTYGSQQDIMATLFNQLNGGRRHPAYRGTPFSKDLFNPAVPHYAFFMMNDGFGLAHAQGSVVYDHKLQRKVYGHGPQQSLWLDYGKALTQILFDDIAQR